MSDWPETTFELWQDGMPVAEVEAPDRQDAVRTILHYAAMYAQDGAVEIVEVTRKAVTL